MLSLCEKLGLKPAEDGELRPLDMEFFEIVHPTGDSEIQIGSGESGYPGFYVIFEFDKDGVLKKHSVLE
jgi:hypothetical protein